MLQVVSSTTSISFSSFTAGSELRARTPLFLSRLLWILFRTGPFDRNFDSRRTWKLRSVVFLLSSLWYSGQQVTCPRSISISPRKYGLLSARWIERLIFMNRLAGIIIANESKRALIIPAAPPELKKNSSLNVLNQIRIIRKPWTRNEYGPVWIHALKTYNIFVKKN